MSRPTKARQTPRSRFAPQPTAGLRLEERDEQLLCDLYLHRFMARGQLEALYFTSTVRCNARLRQLFDYGFVKRYYLPAAPYGAQAIYSIGKRAVPLIASRLEVEADDVARQQRGTRTPTFIEHTLEVVNVWLALRQACAHSDGVQIERWLPEMLCRHEYEITREITRDTTPEIPQGFTGHRSHDKAHDNTREIAAKPIGRWRKEVFKPDAFVRLKSQRRFHNFFIEVDLGHTSSRQFLGKLMTHRRYLESGLFEEIYAGNEFHTLVLTTGPRRLRNLAALVAQQESDLFWLTTFEEMRMTGILGAIWHKTAKSRAGLL